MAGGPNLIAFGRPVAGGPNLIAFGRPVTGGPLARLQWATRLQLRGED